jgi:hypothetical protein
MIKFIFYKKYLLTTIYQQEESHLSTIKNRLITIGARWWTRLIGYDFTYNLASSLWKIIVSMRPCIPPPLILRMVIIFPTLPLGCSPMTTFAMGATTTIPNTPPTHTKLNKE